MALSTVEMMVVRRAIAGTNLINSGRVTAVTVTESGVRLFNRPVETNLGNRRCGTAKMFKKSGFSSQKKWTLSNIIFHHHTLPTFIPTATATSTSDGVHATMADAQVLTPDQIQQLLAAQQQQASTSSASTSAPPATSSQHRLKTSFKKRRSFEPFYTVVPLLSTPMARSCSQRSTSRSPW